MAHSLEIALKPELFDAEGAGVSRQANDYFGFSVTSVRTVNILTIDIDLTFDQLEAIRREIFANPISQISAYTPLDIDFDWLLWVGYRPGVRDNPGSTAVEAVQDFLKISIGDDEGIYTSKRFCLKADNLSPADAERIARELLANATIQRWKVISRTDWDPSQGLGLTVPKVRIDHTPTVTPIPIDTDETLMRISDERNLALNPNDIPTIREYYLRKDVVAQRQAVGLADPTDVELEYISQARSDHCNHNTFKGLFRYRDLESGRRTEVDDLFATCIEGPTVEIQRKKPWVISVLWDNAGVGRFNEDYYYVITGETHNSPSNMEAYGGAITGIVGVYRDPMGTGKGSKLVAGMYGYCVGPRDYAGPLQPTLHPKRLLDGIIAGVRDGGNKSGIPTPFGQVWFDESYLGKCLVFVTAVGLMPARINGEPCERKTTTPGDLIIMCGGRVGKDGIHGVTAASEGFSAHTPAGHVQIGDPYTQKKMHDFLLEARDQGLIAFITDNGGGGLSSSVGESARFSNGCLVELEKVPLKYSGLDQWEIWVSESQERMTVAVKPEHLDAFMALSEKHAVESTVIGRYTDTGKLHITYDGRTCAYVDLDLLTSQFPQWSFEAEWRSPELRGLEEPVLEDPADGNALIQDMLSRPNIASKEWIIRQYDHEVQGTSVVKPLVGKGRDVNSDAVVIRPHLPAVQGLAMAQAVLPDYSRIDTYDMVACTIDEAVRRVIAVGGDPDHIGGVDNFCWPSVQDDPADNPDGKYKAAQLVRANWALKDLCNAYEIPLLSGKDSMYVDGRLRGGYGETVKVSALPTLQFSCTSIVHDITECVTLDAKVPGDLVYILGETRNELGASEYYAHFGCVGRHVPKVYPSAFMPYYKALHQAIRRDMAASCHGVYRGGLAVHLAMVAMAGELGMDVDLSKLPARDTVTDHTLLYSESPGRFIVTVAPEDAGAFESAMAGAPLACVGTVTKGSDFSITGRNGNDLIRVPISALKQAWKQTFGGLT